MSRTTANYIDAKYDRRKEQVLVWERTEDGERRVVSYDAPYNFFVRDEEGEYKGLYGEKLALREFANARAFDEACKQTPLKYESDIRPHHKVLMSKYYDVKSPTLHYTLLDIEVDYDKSIGYSKPDNPYAPINAITMYHSWSKRLVTIAVPPRSWWKNKRHECNERELQGLLRLVGVDNETSKNVNGSDLKAIISDLDDTGQLPNGPSNWMDFIEDDLKETSDVFLFETEKDLLLKILEEIEDSDVLSGWNSEFFDLPYMMKRTEMVLGPGYLNRYSFELANPPRYAEVMRFGKEQLTGEIFGRQHLDYLALFKNFTFGGRASYSLANIADEELDIPKLEYDDDLSEQYKNDFNFFIRYNIRDVEILMGFDDKFKFIDLANEMAHQNCVLLPKVLGAVHLIDTGIMIYGWNELGIRFPDKVHKSGDGIEGALVMTPRVGFQPWIGSIDINSLYPSTYRALNISPEKIIGQFKNYEDDWKEIKKRSDYMITFIPDSSPNDVITRSAKEWYEILGDYGWSVSAYGTVFDQANGKGVIPSVLESWYNGRKLMKKDMFVWADKADKIMKSNPDGYKSDPEYTYAKEMEAYYDRIQMVRKVQLNSTYGATINEHCRFYDPRLGASTTATGRAITSFMASKSGEYLNGEWHDVVKTLVPRKDGSIEAVYTIENDMLVYGDTDSVYFRTGATNREDAIRIADTAAEVVNDAFPDFMKNDFLCRPGFMELIEAGREIVASQSIFQAKKKYLCKVINSDGYDCDKIKAMGSDIKKSDTPKVVQNFLKTVTDSLLQDSNYDIIQDMVNEFREELKNYVSNPIQIGIPKGVSEIDKYYEPFKKLELTGISRVTMPQNVRSAINHNEQIRINGDTTTNAINPGDKIRIFYLKPNDYGYTSIAISADADSLPPWFSDFEIDMKLMEEKLVDLKLSLIFDAIGWEVPSPQTALTNDLLSF